jgi:hypothetical protein
MRQVEISTAPSTPRKITGSVSALATLLACLDHSGTWGYGTILVEGNGCGIRKGNREKLFTPFSQPKAKG